MMNRKELFISGRWVPAFTGKLIEVHDANTGMVMGTIPAGEAEDIDRAVEAACSAQEAWPQTPVGER